MVLPRLNVQLPHFHKCHLLQTLKAGSHLLSHKSLRNEIPLGLSVSFSKKMSYTISRSMKTQKQELLTAPSWRTSTVADCKPKNATFCSFCKIENFSFARIFSLLFWRFVSLRASQRALSTLEIFASITLLPLFWPRNTSHNYSETNITAWLQLITRITGNSISISKCTLRHCRSYLLIILKRFTRCHRA